MTLDDCFNPNRLRFNKTSIIEKPEVGKVRLPRHKKGELFLMGPIPWDWLTLAAKAGGKALHVSVVLWFLAAMGQAMGKSAQVRLRRLPLAQLGVSRYSAYRALKELERSGLVSVQRRSGALAVVTILDAPHTVLDEETEKSNEVGYE